MVATAPQSAIAVAPTDRGVTHEGNLLLTGFMLAESRRLVSEVDGELLANLPASLSDAPSVFDGSAIDVIGLVNAKDSPLIAS